MYKGELVRKTAKTSGLSIPMCDYITAVFVEHLKESLIQGHDVVFHNFGAFRLSWKTKFSGNLMFTADGERYKAKPRPKLKFIAHHSLLEGLSHLTEDDLVTHNRILKYGKRRQPWASRGKGQVIYDIATRTQRLRKK